MLIVLKENDKKAFKGSDVYDIYRQFYRVVIQADPIISKLKWKLEHIDSDSTFGSAENKWLYFNNQLIRDYEGVKYILLAMLVKLESEDTNSKYANVFCNNFMSKSLNGRIDEYTAITHIDKDFQLIAYQFEFIKDAKEVKKFRSFDKLFKEIKFDLSTEEKRKNFIQATKPQIDEIYRLLEEYEMIMAEYYTIRDLFLSDK